LCGHPAGTNYITWSLCRHRQRVRTRLRVPASTGSFSTAWLATLPELPHAAVRLASSTIAGALQAYKLPVAAVGALLAAAAASELVVVGARWGLWDPWGRRLELGTFTSRFWTLLWHVGHVFADVGYVSMTLDMYG
jgi:hypothetical protein